MEDDEVSGVPINMPMGQAPQGIFQRPPEKKKKRLTKKQQTQREKKIKHNLDIRLGILPPNTPPKKLTEEEHIEFQQRLVNIKNINISRSTAKSGFGPTIFSTPPMEIPPQYPALPPNMPIPLSAPVSAGYAIGGSGQIIPVPMVRPHQGLIGASEGLLRIMDKADRKSADKPINTPQGQVPRGQADEKQQAMVGDDVERGAGINWLQQGQQSRRGQPMFPDDKYIGPYPMRSKFEREKEMREQEEVKRQEREKREEHRRNTTGSAYDPFGNIPPSHTRFNPMAGGPSQQEGKMQHEINVLKEELRMGKVSGIEAENKARRITFLEDKMDKDRAKWRDKRAEGAERKRSKSAQPRRFNIVEETQQGVPAQMNQNPLSIAVDEPTPVDADAGRIDRPSQPTYDAIPVGMRYNMGGELERIPSAEIGRMPSIEEVLSPQQKEEAHARGDAAWAIASGQASPVAEEETKAEEAAPPPAVPQPAKIDDMRERLIEKFGLARERSKEPRAEADKAREYFREKHHTAKGESLFDGARGGVNRDLTYYYKNIIGVPKDTPREKWEDYKRAGHRGETQGQGHKKYMENEAKFKEQRKTEPTLTRQIYEYRRAMKRDAKRAKPKINPVFKE